MLVLLGCSSTPSDKEQANQENAMIIEIQHYQVPCVGESVQWCMLFKEKGSDDLNFEYSDIEGLEYEWGYNYQLEVETVKEINPPSDSPGGFMKLKKIIKKEKVVEGDTFELLIIDPEYGNLMSKGEKGYDLMGIAVSSDLPETSIDEKVSAGGTLIGTFKHAPAKNELQLINLKTE